MCQWAAGVTPVDVMACCNKAQNRQYGARARHNSRAQARARRVQGGRYRGKLLSGGNKTSWMATPQLQKRPSPWRCWSATAGASNHILRARDQINRSGWPSTGATPVSATSSAGANPPHQRTDRPAHAAARGRSRAAPNRTAMRARGRAAGVGRRSAAPAPRGRPAAEGDVPPPPRRGGRRRSPFAGRRPPPPLALHRANRPAASAAVEHQ